MSGAPKAAASGHKHVGLQTCPSDVPYTKICVAVVHLGGCGIRSAYEGFALVDVEGSGGNWACKLMIAGAW